MTSYLHDAGAAEGARGIERASAAAAAVEAAAGMHHEAGVEDSAAASVRAESSGFPCWETWRRGMLAARRSTWLLVRPETVR